MKQVIQAFKTTLKKKPFQVIVLVISIICGIAIQLVPPQILKNIIDNYVAVGKVEGIWNIAFLYLIVIALSGVFDFLRELAIAIVGENMLSQIRYTMAKKLSKLPISYFTNNSVGNVMSYFTSDVDAVGTMITSGVIGMVADGLKAIGIIFSIYLLDHKLVIYVIVLIPLIYIITRCFKKATLKAQIAGRKAVGAINVYIQEVFNGIETIKLFNKEDYFVDFFQEPLNKNLEAVHKTSIFDSLFPCIMQVLRAVIITSIVILAAPNGLVTVGLSVGAIAACVELISRMLSPIESIAMEFQTIQEAIAGLRRIEEFYGEEEEKKTFIKNVPMNIEKMDIHVKDMTFAYEDGYEVIKDVSFSVKSGTKVALVGRTGSGKSTILNLVSGLYEPLHGSVTIGGFNPFLLEPNMRRRIFGIVPQNFNIYDGTIKEAITLYDESITEEEVIIAAKRVGLHEDIVKLEKGYDTLIGEGEVQLSNGQYQLLSLACAIVCNPPVLLLDEVMSGLDVITEKRVFHALKGICLDRTLLTISHRASGIVDADEVIILNNGKIVEQGSPKDLEGKEGWYKRYIQMESLGWKIN